MADDIGRQLQMGLAQGIDIVSRILVTPATFLGDLFGGNTNLPATRGLWAMAPAPGPASPTMVVPTQQVILTASALAESVRPTVELQMTQGQIARLQRVASEELALGGASKEPAVALDHFEKARESAQQAEALQKSLNVSPILTGVEQAKAQVLSKAGQPYGEIYG